MKNKIKIGFALLMLASNFVLHAQNEQEAPFEPTKESLSQFEIPEWIKDAKLGFWAHWGPQAQAAQGDWYARGMYIPGSGGRGHYEHHVKTYGHPSKFGFKDLIKTWKADKFDEKYADFLLKKYKYAGADFFVSLVNHHDNFDLWNSKYHQWNAVKIGPKKNIVKIWEDATRNNGLKFGITSHIATSPEWWEANKNSDEGGNYDGNNPKYADLYHPKDWKSKEYNWEYKWFQRVSDVIEQHNPDFIYNDGGIPFQDTYGLKLLANYFNQNYRTHNNHLEGFMLSKSFNDVDFSIFDSEYCYHLKPFPRTWVDDTFIGHWFWNEKFEEGEIPFCSSDYQIDHLIDVVSKNGVRMVVIPQRGDGTVHEKILQVLDEMGKWMKVNGEGIKGSRPFRICGEGPSIVEPKKEAELQQGNFVGGRQEVFRLENQDYMQLDSRHFRFTQSKDGKYVYAFMLGWPDDKKEIRMSTFGLYQLTVDSCELLGANPDVKWKQSNSFLTIQLPKQAPFEQAVCFKLKVHL